MADILTGWYIIALATIWCHFQHGRTYGCRDTGQFVGLPIEFFHFFIPIYCIFIKNL